MERSAATVSEYDTTAPWRATLRRRLRTWYARHARVLPWRRTEPNAYHVWLSEIMLQQTQVATVRPYFKRFISALPTIERLASAQPDEVMRLWERLGYYRRARQLHKAAQQIVRDHGGRFPSDPEAVRRLPGIGRYTAGAILSIAFGQRQPILEANTRRLYARLLAMREDPTSKSAEAILWQFAESLLPARHAGDFNQALMELGSQICAPRQPRCDECPLASLCPTALAGLQELIPPPKRKPRPTRVQAAAVAIRRRGRVLMIQHNGKGRFSGLWDFPRVELSAGSSPAAKRQLADDVEQLCGVRPMGLQHLSTMRHTVTRYHITLDCYLAEPTEQDRQRRSGPNGTTTRWVSYGELAELPMSTTGRKLARLVAGHEPEA